MRISTFSPGYGPIVGVVSFANGLILPTLKSLTTCSQSIFLLSPIELTRYPMHPTLGVRSETRTPPFAIIDSLENDTFLSDLFNERVFI